MLLARHGLAKCPPREDTDGPPGEILGDAPGAPTPQPSPHRAWKPLSPISVPCLLSECRNCGCGGRRQPHWPWEVRLKAPSHIQSGETNPTPEDMSHWNWARPQGGSERPFQVGREAADASEARLLGRLHPQPSPAPCPTELKLQEIRAPDTQPGHADCVGTYRGLDGPSQAHPGSSQRRR